MVEPGFVVFLQVCSLIHLATKVKTLPVLRSCLWWIDAFGFLCENNSGLEYCVEKLFLGCLFSLGFVAFAGCVWKSHAASQKGT